MGILLVSSSDSSQYLNKLLAIIHWFGKDLLKEKNTLSHDIASGSDITPCNKIDNITTIGLQISSIT